MVADGMDYGQQAQGTLDGITGDAPYGATTIAAGNGSRQPSQKELDGVRCRGRRVAEVAATIHG